MACPDTTCSTRPSRSPGATSAAAANCTTKARWAGSRRVVDCFLLHVLSSLCYARVVPSCLNQDYTGVRAKS